MKIQKQDIYHGTTLMQIVEHPSFKALNRASGKYGHYLVNTDRQVFVKYSKKKSRWQFTFQPDELAAIGKSIDSGAKVFVCLVCGHVTVCALSADEFQPLVNLEANAQQSVRIEVPTGGSCHVRGSQGQLRRTIPHKSFPDKVFV